MTAVMRTTAPPGEGYIRVTIGQQTAEFEEERIVGLLTLIANRHRDAIRVVDEHGYLMTFSESDLTEALHILRHANLPEDIS